MANGAALLEIESNYLRRDLACPLRQKHSLFRAQVQGQCARGAKRFAVAALKAFGCIFFFYQRKASLICRENDSRGADCRADPAAVAEISINDYSLHSFPSFLILIGRWTLIYLNLAAQALLLLLPRTICPAIPSASTLRLQTGQMRTHSKPLASFCISAGSADSILCSMGSVA